jgi:phosphoserine phosphatase RsbU/P
MTTDLRDLKESNEFLNLLLDNINSAVLIANENFQIFQVNNFFLELFDSATETVVDKRFGAVSGCVHSRLRKTCPVERHQPVNTVC